MLLVTAQAGFYYRYALHQGLEILFFQGFFLIFWYFYSTLRLLLPLRFHCVGGRWDRTQCWNFFTVIGSKEPSRNRVIVPARQAT
jgi:hypothetical protein